LNDGLDYMETAMKTECYTLHKATDAELMCFSFMSCAPKSKIPDVGTWDTCSNLE